MLQGSWKFWSPEEMKGDYSDVIEFDKNVIMAHFGLEYKHMPLFAVLATGKDLKTAHLDVNF